MLLSHALIVALNTIWSPGMLHLFVFLESTGDDPGFLPFSQARRSHNCSAQYQRQFSSVPHQQSFRQTDPTFPRAPHLLSVVSSWSLPMTRQHNPCLIDVRNLRVRQHQWQTSSNSKPVFSTATASTVISHRRSHLSLQSGQNVWSAPILPYHSVCFSTILDLSRRCSRNSSARLFRLCS